MAGAKMPYIVRPGDYLAKLASVHGFDADEVWTDPSNKELADTRPNPNILEAGDILYIPQAEKEALPIEKGAENNYAAAVPRIEIVLVFTDGDQPLANEPCEVLGLGDSDPDLPRATNGEGQLTLRVPVVAQEASVHFPKRDLSFQILVGDMDPASGASGVRKRLMNLGYLPSSTPPGMEDDEVLRIALFAFQSDQGLEATGELDEATRKAIVDRHQL